MADSGFQGINPAMLTQLMRSMTSGVNGAQPLANSYLAQFSRLGVATGAVNKLLADYAWATSQQPMLQRRWTLASHQPSGDWLHGFATVGAGALAYTTPGAAKSAGTAAAKQMQAYLKGKDVTGVQKELAALKANEYDPAYTAAFFTELGTAGLYALAQYAQGRGDSEAGEEEVKEVLGNALATSNYGLDEFLTQQKAATNKNLAYEVNAWWNLLPSAEQDKLIKDAPAQVGQLDGLPATVRDTANRIVFNNDYTRTEGQVGKLESQIAALNKQITDLENNARQYSGDPFSSSAYQSKLAALQGKLASLQGELSPLQGDLAGMSAIKAKLGQPGKGQNGLPPVYLLGFDTNGNGHAIVSFGDPDTATNVVTYVPGVGSRLSAAGGDLTRTERLWAQANLDDPKASTASIYWLGYNAPQLSSSLSSDLQIGYTNIARAAAPSLDSFAAGLQAAHVPSFAAHTVMLGHSYGSLVVGEATTRDQGKLADDLILVGSPGVGVDSFAGLDMSGKHVWAGQAAWDEVPDLPPWNPLDWGRGVSHFGTNPASPAFGAEDFQVASGSPWPPFSAHSSYWDPGSTSLRNMARIVDGQYGSVSLTPGSDANYAHPVHPDPEPQQPPTPPATSSPARKSAHPAPSPTPGQQPSPTP